jgi:hypothetical protein
MPQDQLSLLQSLTATPTTPAAQPTLRNPAPTHRPTRTHNRRRSAILLALNDKLRHHNIKLVRDAKYRAWHEWKFEYVSKKRRRRTAKEGKGNGDNVAPSKKEVEAVLAALGIEDLRRRFMEMDGEGVGEGAEAGYEGDEEGGERDEDSSEDSEGDGDRGEEVWEEVEDGEQGWREDEGVVDPITGEGVIFSDDESEASWVELPLKKQKRS